MNKEDKSLCRLPKKRTGLRIAWLSSWPMWLIGLVGLALYVIKVALISGLELYFSEPGHAWIKSADGTAVDWWDIVYFNFISVMTIGYGDYSPNGDAARFVTILEALLGAGVLGITLATLTAKFLSPPKECGCFSPATRTIAQMMRSSSSSI